MTLLANASNRESPSGFAGIIDVQLYPSRHEQQAAARRGVPAPIERPLNMRLIAAFFATSISGLLTLWLIPAGPFVLVFTRPGQTQQEAIDIIASAHGTFVENGRFPWITLAHSDERDFPSRLLKAGALLVVNGVIASVCNQDT